VDLRATAEFIQESKFYGPNGLKGYEVNGERAYLVPADELDTLLKWAVAIPKGGRSEPTEGKDLPRKPTLEDLRACWYAPGDYMIRCLDCKQQFTDCDKRAARCYSCAVSMFHKAEATHAQILREGPEGVSQGDRALADAVRGQSDKMLDMIERNADYVDGDSVRSLISIIRELRARQHARQHAQAPENGGAA
jgi:DNA-directed RNA polymerase subunit RPC12/RpoP